MGRPSSRGAQGSKKEGKRAAMRANSLALRRCVTRTVVTTCSRGDLGRNFSPGPHGPAGRGQGRKSLVVPTQSLSIPNNGSLTDSLGIETELGRDVSSVPNRELGQFRALVLDVSYRPLDTVPWTRAIVLDYFDKVDVLEYYESFVRSAKDMHFLPAVIRVKFYVDNRRKIKSAFDKGVPLTRKNVYARDRHQCVYCSSTKNLTLDHTCPAARAEGRPGRTW